MEQRDLIKDQIEQFCQVLGNILAKLLTLQSASGSTLQIKMFHQQLKAELDIDVNELLSFDKSQMETYLSEKKLSAQQIDLLSKYVEATGFMLSNENPSAAGQYLRKNSIKAILYDTDYKLPLLRQPVALKSAVFSDYIGTYALNENMMFEVIAENDSLFVLLGPNMVALIPQSENQFYMLDHDAASRFERDSAGNVSKMVLLNGFIDSEQYAKRVK